MRLPFNLVPLDKWVAFHAPLPKDKHRIIVIKKTIDDLKYFYVTSQVDNAKRVSLYDKGSIAEFNKAEWDSLTVESSCVQCNKKHLYTEKLSNFEKLYNEGSVDYIGEVPNIVKTKIRAAICASKSFTDKEKEIYSF